RGGARVDFTGWQRPHTIMETRRNDGRSGQARRRGFAEIPGSVNGKIRKESTMTNSNDDRAPRPQAEVVGDLDGAGTLNGRAGASVFSIGGPDGRGGTAAGASPYELLSASLAACTAMTIRLQARRRKIPLSHVEVAVSYHHGGDGGRDS